MHLESPALTLKRLEAQVRQNLRNFDIRTLEIKTRAALAQLQQNFVDAQIYVQAYSLSETRPEQLKSARVAKKWLNQATKNLVAVSDIFSPADVAQLSAQIEQIIGQLK